MKKLIIFMFSLVLFESCSSEKTLLKQIKYDWDINYISSQDGSEEKQYNFKKNLTNSSLRKQTRVQPSLQSVKFTQDFLTSNDNLESTVLTNNYNYKKLPLIIQNEKDYKSLNEKPQIFEDEKQAVIDAKERPETINFLVGKVMQKTKGKADPVKTLELIKSKLEK